MWHVERLYCKRPIQCLASSKILTPHPLTAQCVSPFGAREGHTRWLERGVGVNFLEDARHSSVLYICKDFVVWHVPPACQCSRSPYFWQAAFKRSLRSDSFRSNASWKAASYFPAVLLVTVLKMEKIYTDFSYFFIINKNYVSRKIPLSSLLHPQTILCRDGFTMHASNIFCQSLASIHKLFYKNMVGMILEFSSMNTLSPWVLVNDKDDT